MTSALTYNLKGEAGEKVNLPKELFEEAVSPALLSQAVKVYLSNQREANAKTKTRSDVARTTAKMYKQKGTGRARHGSYAAPIFVGGGIAHGPSGEQNYKKEMPKKMRRMALLGALAEKAAKKTVVIIKGGDKASGKTKQVKWMEKRTLVVAGKNQEKLKRGLGNLEGVTVATAENLNPYLILAHKQLAVTEEALLEMKKYANS